MNKKDFLNLQKLLLLY